MRSGLRVALVSNVKDNVAVAPDAPSDALADALLAGGHQVVCLEGDETLLDTVRQTAPDICFNIAEGLRGDGRES